MKMSNVRWLRDRLRQAEFCRAAGHKRPLLAPRGRCRLHGSSSSCARHARSRHMASADRLAPLDPIVTAQFGRLVGGQVICGALHLGCVPDLLLVIGDGDLVARQGAPANPVSQPHSPPPFRDLQPASRRDLGGGGRHPFQGHARPRGEPRCCTRLLEHQRGGFGFLRNRL